MRERIDRNKECPFMIRVFARTGGHHDERDFTLKSTPSHDETGVYAWKDSTFREIMLAFVSVSKSFNIHTPRYSVKHLIFNSRRASYDSKDLGNIFIKDLCRDATESRGLAAKTLEDIRFYSRDFLDIAIMPSTGPSSGPVGATSSASLAIPRGGSGGRDLFPARGSFSIKGSGRILQNNANDRRGGGLDVNRNKRRAIDAPSWDRAPPSKRQRSPPGHRSRSRSRSRSPPASSSNQKSPSSPAARRMSKSPTPRGAGWD